MNYIDRYVYAVKRHLPPHQKEEVGEELKALILEQISEDAPFEKIEKVLKSLGSPRKLAHSYRNQDRSLIGPEHFEFYLDVLKLTLKIFIGLNIALGFLNMVTAGFSEGADIGLIIGIFFEDVLGGIITTTITMFGVVTLGFVAAIHFKWIDGNDEWMLKDLPELPKKEVNPTFQYRKVLFETIGVMAGLTVLLVVLRLPWLAFNDDLGEITIITPANYNMYFPFLLSLIGFYGGVQAFYLSAQRLTKLVMGLRGVLSILIITVFSFMFFGPSEFLLAQDITALSDIIGVSASRLESQINIILGVILLSIVVSRSVDLYKDIKAYKKESLS
jgi:hypothetical protein